MKVIKITKYSRNNEGTFYIILEDWKCFKKEDGSVWEDNIDYYVDERCYKDPAGHNYGWRYEWEFVEDTEEIKSIVNEEINRKKKEIERINERINSLESVLN